MSPENDATKEPDETPKRMYRVHLRRESEQAVEFDEDDIEAGDTPVGAANELVDAACWYTDGYDVNGIETSDDGGATWVRLPLSEVLRLERATA